MKRLLFGGLVVLLALQAGGLLLAHRCRQVLWRLHADHSETPTVQLRLSRTLYEAGKEGRTELKLHGRMFDVRLVHLTTDSAIVVAAPDDVETAIVNAMRLLLTGSRGDAGPPRALVHLLTLEYIATNCGHALPAVILCSPSFLAANECLPGQWDGSVAHPPPPYAAAA